MAWNGPSNMSGRNGTGKVEKEKVLDAVTNRTADRSKQHEFEILEGTYTKIFKKIYIPGDI
jgi:hypothetical protein